LELNRRKIELTNKVKKLQDKKKAIQLSISSGAKNSHASAPEGAVSGGLPSSDDIRSDIMPDLN
jgi:hypothetical protein